MSPDEGPIRVVVQIDLSAADLDSFEAYESEVLELLEDHGARLHVRLRGRDRPAEIHILSFPSRESRQNYLADPRREMLQPLFKQSGAKSDIWEAVEPG